MRKIKKSMITIGFMTMIASPLAIVLSCGHDNENDLKPWDKNPFDAGDSGGGGDEGPGLDDLLEGTALANVTSVSANWGIARKSDILRAEGESAMVERQASGVPITEGIPPQEVWNWAVDGAEQGFDDSQATGNGIAFENRNSENSRFDYKKEGFTPASPIGYDNNEQAKEHIFDRATIREVQPRIMAPRLKETQGDFAQFTDMAPTRKTGSRLGFNKGINNSAISTSVGSIPYMTSRPVWVPTGMNLWYTQWPTANEINMYHEAGVPVQGIIFLMSGHNDNFAQYMGDPGPEGDYPVAKGLAELANFYGFDGWWVDQEAGLSDSKYQSFLKALSSYSKTDGYTIESGPNQGKRVELSEWYKVQREKYNYSPLTNQMISNYSSSMRPARNIDGSMTYQLHGRDTSVSSNLSTWRQAIDYNKDRNFGSGAPNWPEDGYEGTLDIFGKHYAGSHDSSFTNSAQNQKSVWFWSHEDSSTETDSTLFSSYNGDPRLVDDLSKWALGNSFREKTSIIGRNPWSTNFGVGKGKTFSLFGGADVNDYIINSSSDGWKNTLFQDELPIYRWIVDTYNEQGQKADLSINPVTKKLQGRTVEPFFNESSDHPYFGGNSLDFKGTLAQNYEMVTKLYASYIPIESQDKFKIIIKDNWENEGDRILPEFSAWTNNDSFKDPLTNRDYFKYKSDGTEKDPLIIDNPTGQAAFLKDAKLGWGNDVPESEIWNKRSDLLDYDKDIAPSWDQTTRHDIKPAVKSLKNNWLELTYDLSSLNNQVMWGYGFKAKNLSSDAANIQKLSIGNMQYIPHEYQTRNDIDFANIQTIKVWNSDKNFYQRARVTWDLSVAGKDPWTDQTETEKALADINKYLVFYLDENGAKTQLAWAGTRPSAYLDLIDKSKTSQNIEVIALDAMNNIIKSRMIKVKLTN